MAALALWNYSEASARYIFGDATGDPIADLILNALRGLPNGLTRTEISNLLSHNASREQIDSALTFLMDHDLIWMLQEDTKGRPIERWMAL
jgi:hypothetical protein